MKRSVPYKSVNSFALGIQQRGQQELVWSLLWLVFVCVVAFFWGLASTGLVDETEPLFAEAARQMYETGDWVTPYFNGVTRFDKPPLVYWLMAISFHIFGVSEWSVRLPSALSASVLVGMGFYTLRRFGFSKAERAIAYIHPPSQDLSTPLSRMSQRNLFWSAMIGSGIMALHPETIVWARIGVSDMLLSSCIGIALFAFFFAYAQPECPERQRNWTLAAYTFLGLAVLTKGPVGIVLPGLIVGAFLLYTGHWRKAWREMHLVKGAILFLAITVPWHVLVIAANGRAYIDTFFGYHNVERFTSVVNGHAAPWYFYFAVVAVGFLPWSPFLPWAIARLRPFAVNYWQTQPRSAHLGIFALIWFLVIFGFFTVAVTKLPSYVLPLMPAAAVMVALAWSDRLCPPTERHSVAEFGFWLTCAISIAMLFNLSMLSVISPAWMGDDPSMPGLPDLVQKAGTMAMGGVIWGMAAIVAIGIVILRRGRWLWAVNLAAFSAFTLFSILPTYQLADRVRQQPLRQIAEAAIAEQQANQPLYMVGFMKPTLVFYTQKPVTYVERPTDLVETMTKAEHSGDVLVVGTAPEIQAIQWPADQKTNLVTTNTYLLTRLSALSSNINS